MPTPEQYLLALLRPLVNDTEAIRMVTTSDEMGMLITITIPSEDMGSVIGKGGETAKAVRHLLRIAGIKNKMRVSLKITEPDGAPYRPMFKEHSGPLPALA